ncbi:MAG: hypothetical protein IPM82_06300 [Saprospiraceae bacterium]|nr:hypothetical protein [Saprospiraceae bacterium]
MENLTSISGVDGIAGMNDPVMRNLLITQSYHEISGAISQRIGPYATWCTFATWASKQAGQSIRQEDLANGLGQSLRASPELGQALSNLIDAAILKGAKLNKARITQLVWDTLNPKAAMARASAAVARGNQKVFAEIAREFARFMACCLEDSEYDAANIARFCEALKPGDPPNGQLYLRKAFVHYYQAIFEADEKAKAELILLANLEIGFHEQTRLQPEIAEALEASVEDPKVFKSKLLDVLFPYNPWVKYIGPLFTALSNRPTPLDEAIQRFAGMARHHLRLFLTKHLMELGFPKGLRLRLGQDLKARFPVALQQLTIAELVVLLKQIDPTPNDLHETGAIDWADLPDRLHFIADLFRCFQESQDLLTPPFEPAQIIAIVAGRLPIGEL